MKINKVHHIAIICSNHERSLRFYTEVLGMNIIAEHYRAERCSYKTDLALNGDYIIELFSFPDPPARLSYPEAAGLRHMAFEVDNIDDSTRWLEQNAVSHQPLRTDVFTGKRFLFFQDPDGLPIEFYEK